jgi:hypothetical protein
VPFELAVALEAMEVGGQQEHRDLSCDRAHGIPSMPQNCALLKKTVQIASLCRITPHLCATSSSQIRKKTSTVCIPIDILKELI